MSELDRISSNLLAINKKADSIWFDRKKFSAKHEAKLRERIHTLDLLSEAMYARLFQLLEEEDFEDVEVINQKKVFNGQKEVTRLTLCDGVHHLVVNKNYKLQYGYRCSC